MNRLRMWAESRVGRCVAWACLAVMAVCLVEVILIAVAGGTWDRFHIRASNPRPRLFVAALAWFGWYFLRRGVHNGLREWARFAGRAVLGGMSLSLALVTAEVGLRMYLQGYQSRQSLDKLDAIEKALTTERIQSTHPMGAIIRKSQNPRVVYELRPNLDREFGRRVLRTNALGMRMDRLPAVEKPAGCVRIVGLGDSGMFGWNVEQGESYMDVLQKCLNQRTGGRTYEVLNFGVPGYNTQLELELFKYRALAFKPDIVVVGWCDNDFGLPFFIPQEGQWRRRDVCFLYALIFDRKKFADLALNKVRDQRDFDKAKVPERVRRGTDVEGVKGCFAELQALGRQHGFRVLVFGPMQKEAVAICRALDLPYYNTWDKVDASRYPKDYCVHFMHPTAGGHRVLGEHLAQELADRGWL